MTETAPPRPRPALPRWLIPVLLALLVGLYLGLREPPQPPQPPAQAAPTFGPASPEAKALLGELAVGDAVGPFVVEGIAGPGAEGREPAEILVHLRRPGVRFAISVVPRGAIPQPAPEQSARHDLYFGHAQPEDAPLPGEEINAALTAIRERVAARE